MSGITEGGVSIGFGVPIPQQSIFTWEARLMQGYVLLVQQAFENFIHARLTSSAVKHSFILSILVLR